MGNDGMRRSLGITLMALAVLATAACDSSSSHKAAPLTKQAMAQRAIAQHRLDVVLGDQGLEFPPAEIPAATYTVTFRDGRSRRPAGQHVNLYFGVNGPQIASKPIALGSHGKMTLIQNMTALVEINPSPDQTKFWQQVQDGQSLTIKPTEEFPTPAT
jgi:hypothetical protein